MYSPVHTKKKYQIDKKKSSGIKKNNPSDVEKFLQIKFNNIHMYTNIIMD